MGDTNLASVIEGHDADRVALVGAHGVTTYGGLRTDVARLRGGLTAAGVARGDRLAIVCENDWCFVAAYLAAVGLGAVAVPLNPASPPPEIARQLAAVEPTAVVVGPGGQAAARELGGSRPASIRHVFAAAGVDVAGSAALDGLLDADPVPAADAASGDLAVLMFTAGTSGPPRAAMLTHGSLGANLEQLQRHPGRGLTASDVTLGVLPMCHIFGLNVVLGLSLIAGATVVLADRFDAAATLEAIDRHGITVLAGAPPMFAAWAALPVATEGAMRSVRLAVSGAAPLDRDVAAAFERRFGVPVREGYGLTEASPVVTSSLVAEPVHPGSVGVPLPGVEVRLVDADGADVLTGDEGEVWVRGDNVFAGYWRDDEATRQVLTPEGWLMTGDVAVLGDDGELYLVGRNKDLIIVNGFNVYPAEVEDVLASAPGVAEVAVVGVPHAASGEAIRAYVVRVPGADVSADDLTRFCAERLARYKCPAEVAFVPSLPRGTAGKLLRRNLAELEQPEGRR